MVEVVECDAGASQMPLALRFGDAVRRAAADVARRPGLDHLRGTIVIVVDDAWLQFTLRFAYGRLSIHTGAVGMADITVRGPEAALESLLVLPFRTKWPALLPRRIAELVAVRRLLVDWAAHSLKAYGALTHPRLLLELLAVIAGPPLSPKPMPSGL